MTRSKKNTSSRTVANNELSSVRGGFFVFYTFSTVSVVYSGRTTGTDEKGEPSRTSK